MSRGANSTQTVFGRRLRARREELGWSQEKVGVLIGIDESSSRARISRYELSVHEPPVPTAKLLADALMVPLAHLYCEDDGVAKLLLALHEEPVGERAKRVGQFIAVLEGGTSELSARLTDRG